MRLRQRANLLLSRRANLHLYPVPNQVNFLQRSHHLSHHQNQVSSLRSSRQAYLRRYHPHVHRISRQVLRVMNHHNSHLHSPVTCQVGIQVACHHLYLQPIQHSQLVYQAPSQVLSQVASRQPNLQLSRVLCRHQSLVSNLRHCRQVSRHRVQVAVHLQDLHQDQVQGRHHCRQIDQVKYR